ncbi:MAG: hypothetical protein M1829_006688 [Trizodia sp. TS-e1964]|nr:MAG: hypothetical protein M1829_006688 [Trizodia sp. TS-e1964]
MRVLYFAPKSSLTASLLVIALGLSLTAVTGVFADPDINQVLCSPGKLLFVKKVDGTVSGCLSEEGVVVMPVSDKCIDHSVEKSPTSKDGNNLLVIANPGSPNKYFYYAHSLHVSRKNVVAALFHSNDGNMPSKLKLNEDALVYDEAKGPTGWVYFADGKQNIPFISTEGEYDLKCEKPILIKTTTPIISGPESKVKTPASFKSKIKKLLCSSGWLLLVDAVDGSTKGCVSDSGKPIQPASDKCPKYEVGMLTDKESDNDLMIIDSSGSGETNKYCYTYAGNSDLEKKDSRLSATNSLNCRDIPRSVQSRFKLLDGARLTLKSTTGKTTWALKEGGEDMFVSGAGTLEIKCQNPISSVVTLPKSEATSDSKLGKVLCKPGRLYFTPLSGGAPMGCLTILGDFMDINNDCPIFEVRMATAKRNDEGAFTPQVEASSVIDGITNPN